MLFVILEEREQNELCSFKKECSLFFGPFPAIWRSKERFLIKTLYYSPSLCNLSSYQCSSGTLDRHGETGKSVAEGFANNKFCSYKFTSSKFCYKQECFIFFGPFLFILLEAERFLIRSSLLFPDVLCKREQLPLLFWHSLLANLRCQLRAWPRGYKNIKIHSWKGGFSFSFCIVNCFTFFGPFLLIW